MKKFVLFFALALVSQIVLAQRYGLKLGVNFPNQQFESSGITLTTSSITSFHIEGFADYGVNSIFSIQPSLAVSGKGFKYESQGRTLLTNLIYVEIPVNVVAKFPVSTIGKFFLGAGPYGALGVFGKVGKWTQTNYNGNIFSEEGYKSKDFGLNFLSGFEFSKGFTVNAKYGLGLVDISQDKKVTTKNKVWAVSAGFLF